MPRSGGEADKLGNRYEVIWTIDSLLDIVQGEIDSIEIEPLEKVESKGVEFIRNGLDGTCDYHSVKRQTTQNEWSLTKLTKIEPNGRSILGDLYLKFKKDNKNYCTFVSQTGANDIRELTETARLSINILDFYKRLGSQLNAQFNKSVLKTCEDDVQVSFNFLKRLRICLIDELQLIQRVEQRINLLFYCPNNISINTSSVRTLLGDFIDDNLGKQLNKNLLCQFLELKGFYLKDWATDKSVKEKITQLNQRYISKVKSDLINNSLIPRAEARKAVDCFLSEQKKTVIIVGTAGQGKSCVCAQVVDLLKNKDILFLCIRMDLLDESIVSTNELGKKFGLPVSPVTTLTGYANGRLCVFIIDQLDAISIVSGRNSKLWDLFEELRNEIKEVPNMRLLLLCRSFDLENDYRMRRLTTDKASIEKISISSLTKEEIENSLSMKNIIINLTPQQILILQIPFHLFLFLEGDTNKIKSFTRISELYDNFWERKQNLISQRLNREPKWTELIDKLCTYFSNNQRLNAPKEILEEYALDAKAMCSEHILIFEQNIYRFFHESFFDYVFARRFFANNGDIIELLTLNNQEQHLFRRAQIRQILNYQRDRSPEIYLDNLKKLISNQNIRFHIKKLIFLWLNKLDMPMIEEAKFILSLLFDNYYNSHIIEIFKNSVGWFDVLNKLDFWKVQLYSDNHQSKKEVLWLFSMSDVIKFRSVEIASLLKPFKGVNEEWKQFFRDLMKIGEVYHSREMMDLFLQSIDDGILDDLRPGFAQNDDWWSVLYEMAKEKPEYTAEAIAHWLYRLLIIYDKNEDEPDHFKDLNNHSGEVIIFQIADNAPDAYLTYILPVINKILQKYEEIGHDGKRLDKIWSYRVYCEQYLSANDSLLYGTVNALCKLGEIDLEKFENYIDKLYQLPYDTIAFILLKTWSNFPMKYSDQVINYICNDYHRFEVGYYFSGGGDAKGIVTVLALKNAALNSSEELIHKVLTAIKNLPTVWPKNSRNSIEKLQYKLLKVIPENRLDLQSLKLFKQLHRKFPEVDEIPPRPLKVIEIKSPIFEEKARKMTDAQWIKAMKKYNYEREINIIDPEKGAKTELAPILEKFSSEDKKRFAFLCIEKMDNSISPDYFSAILKGIINQENGKKVDLTSLSLNIVTDLIVRIHNLPTHPSGKDICRAIQKIADLELSPILFDIVSYYAINDPDPAIEAWENNSYGGDPFFNGINTIRGEAAMAISNLIFAFPERFKYFKETIEKLCNDNSLAVKSCTIMALITCLNIDSNFAFRNFLEISLKNPTLYSTRPFQDFMSHAIIRDYKIVRPVLKLMLHSDNNEVVFNGSRFIYLAAFNNDIAEIDATEIRNGQIQMRLAAAEIYASNLISNEFGVICEGYLNSYFNDEDSSIRQKSTECFWKMPGNSLNKFNKLIKNYIDSKAFPFGLEGLNDSLSESAEILPDVVCEIAEKIIDIIYRKDTSYGNLFWSTFKIPELTLRIYQQAKDTEIQKRCLDLIDKMEEFNFFEIDKELEKIDR